MQNSAYAFCWEEASKRYSVPVKLLKAIAEVESNFNPNAIEVLKNGESRGIMQINSYWYDKLEEYEITKEHLYNPCININIGAWILAQEIERYGYSWIAIGAFNAGAYNKNNKERKMKTYRKYASKVLKVLRDRNKNRG